MTLWIFWGLLRFWDGNYHCSFPDFWELGMLEQEDKIKNLYSQDFKALPAFKTCYGQMESRPEVFPGFSCWRARANSSEVNSQEMPSRVGIFQRSDTSLITSLSDSRFLVLYVPFFTSCDAMELAVMGHGR